MADYHVDQESGSWHADYHDGTQAHFTVVNGKVVRAQNPAGTLELGYDAHGRLVSETFNGRRVTYQRNPSGLLSGITSPLGQRITFERDGEQRVKRIIDWSGRAISITYGLNGALQTIDYPNGARLSQQTAPSGLPIHMRLTHPDADGPLFSRHFERDLLDRVVTMRDGQTSIAYSYDKQGRLLGAHSDQDAFCESYTLDAKANRLADPSGSYHINAADRIAQPGFNYDAIGNLTQGRGPRGPAAYTWTSANRLDSAAVQDARAQYRYDAFGRRVEKRVGGRTTHTIWAGAQPLSEIFADAQGEKVVNYLFFPATAVLLAIGNPHQIHYAAFGHRYETLCLTDLSGAAVWQADYDAFGNARIVKGAALFQPFRLAGHYLDAETGLHYCAARYYDPRLGRYLSLDPLFLEGGADNFYAYCDGDPINCIDPTGEFIFIPILIGAALGAAIGAGVEAYRQKQAGKKTDGYQIAKAALMGGAIGALGGAVGALVQAGTAGAVAGTVLGKSAPASLAATGFFSGAAASVAEQCAQAAVSDAAVPPLEITKQAFTDGMVGAAIGLATFGAGAVVTRRAAKAAAGLAHEMPAEQGVKLQKSARQKAAAASPAAQTKGKKASDHSALSTTGEPVNAVTGEVVLTQRDFSLPGRIALVWTRHYGSQCAYDGLLGRGWQSPADARLALEDGLVVFYDGTPGGAVFEKLPTAAPLMEMTNGAVLSATETGYTVQLKSGLAYHFKTDFAGGRSPVSRISDASGNQLTFNRQNGALTGIEDSCGRTIRIEAKRAHQRHALPRKNPGALRLPGRPAHRAVDAAGHAKRFAYQDGRLIRHSDRNRLSFYYAYDAKGRCLHSSATTACMTTISNIRPLSAAPG